MEEDAQPLEVPIIAPVVSKKLEKQLDTPLGTHYSTDYLATLSSNPELIRNVAVRTERAVVRVRTERAVSCVCATAIGFALHTIYMSPHSA
jgi:hypothetical protein